MASHFETIETENLDAVNGGVDWGVTHTVLTQGLNCAGAGALIGGMAGGPWGAAGLGLVAGGACAYTSYQAMKQAGQVGQPPPAAQQAVPPRR